jgi:ATP-binding cassette, subfamily C, bacteriocin exporter
MKRLEILQKRVMDCGPTCLLSVARFKNIDVNIQTIRQSAQTNWSGTTMNGLITSARTMGLDAVGVWADMDALNEVSLPVIAHVKIFSVIPHYWVVYELLDNKIKIMDPAIGLMRNVSTNYFEKVWTKALIIFQTID